MTSKKRNHYLMLRAWNFILDEHVSSLPVNIDEVILRHGWVLRTYQEYAAISKKSVAHIMKSANDDGFVYWSNRESNFVICYNPEKQPSVILQTKTHEVSHIYLGHVTNSAPFLPRARGDVKNEFEKQAKGLTRRILSPSIVLHDCRAIEPSRIMLLCGITREAATYRSNHMKILEQRNKFRTHDLERKVEQKFYPFITDFLPNIRQNKKTAPCTNTRAVTERWNESEAPTMPIISQF